MRVDRFNRLDIESAKALLRPCVDIDRWIDAVVGGRPYADAAQAVEAARAAATPWTVAEIDGALAHHPRIGERAGGDSAEASLSRTEQAGIGASADEVSRALADGNRAYEARFSRVFLIRAAGRSADEILAALRERLAHTDEEEIAVVADELRQIAVLRFEGIFHA